jgi:hypothetical protein
VTGDVDDVQAAIDRREDAVRERDPGLQAGPQAREAGDRSDAQRERDAQGERVPVGGHAGLAMHERVVERVDESEDGGAGEHARLTGRASQRGREARAGAAQGGGGGHAITVPAARSAVATDGWTSSRGSSEAAVRLAAHTGRCVPSDKPRHTGRGSTVTHA